MFSPEIVENMEIPLEVNRNVKIKWPKKPKVELCYSNENFLPREQLSSTLT